MNQPQPTLIVVGGRPGRPKSKHPGTSVHAWIPEALYDRLAQIAIKQETSVSKVVGQILERRLSIR